ncbi:MAG: hypothetical protein HC831_13130 [Chloroflexia bacterium]|nr:hypothetical protein [Chloroflexia bacterium]
MNYERLIEIIATKKGEIKSELAKRLILDKFNNSNFAIYNYVRQNIEMLLTDADYKVKSQLILKTSAELVMVYSFAEFFLQELTRKKSSDWMKMN